MSQIIIAILIVLSLIFIGVILRLIGKIYGLSSEKTTCYNTVNVITKENEQLKKHNKQLIDIKSADEDVLAYLKCLNTPRTEVCKDTPDEGRVCRSRLMDCSKFKNIIFNNPTALWRMEMAVNT